MLIIKNNARSIYSNFAIVNCCAATVYIPIIIKVVLRYA